jgi:hypothetical protein
MQGVWGAARPPSGEREGRSHLASVGTAPHQPAESAKGSARILSPKSLLFGIEIGQKLCRRCTAD